VSIFKVKIRKEEFASGVKNILLTTRNGHQWSGGIPLTIDELKEVADEINKFLELNLIKDDE